MSRINEFTVKFANVNGSGSASANLLFAKALFRMGLPVSPKNIFPSNIQGLPTWYEGAHFRGRLCRAPGKGGHHGRHEPADLPRRHRGARERAATCSTTRAIRGLSTARMSRPSVFPSPRMCAEAYSDPRERQLFKNVVYVGALAALLDIEFDVLEEALNDRFKGKSKLVDANMQALGMGRDYAKLNFECPLPLHVRRCNKNP